jgi:hypothetical protein
MKKRMGPFITNRSPVTFMIRAEKCGYRGDDWPDRHECVRSRGHPSRHVCWCGALHGSGADYTGRWESYVKPELRGEEQGRA